jgi:serine/threonine-protein kinase HipA
LIATPMEAEDVPEVVLTANGRLGQAVKVITNQQPHKFSLAGVQMKFSMKERDGRYNLAQDSGELGDWIIKTPSTQHVDVPLNEFTAMTLAAMAGVDIPEIKLVERDRLDNLPPIKLPDENFAFAIKRFDRNNNTRIHMEDFAQVLVKYPHEKYNSANYEQIGRILFQYSGDGLADAQQFARRLLVNILLANGDAHLKNWSLLYQDKITPRLSPAYDIVTTSVYMRDEREYALNLGKTKEWYKVDLSHFEAWAKKADIPWRAIKPHLADVMDRARAKWPRALSDLPMNDGHKKHLRQHWQALRADFQI